ncbi:MAG: MarR family winged helix-turn-helix transcriptional regulator [Leptospirales bacterium]
MDRTGGGLPFSEKEADNSTGFLIWELTMLWQRDFAAALKPHGLTQVQFVLLASILWLSDKEECVTQVRRARYSKLDVMMTSQVLRSLELRGLILRRSHPTDTRARMLELTQSGRNVAVATIPVVEEVGDVFFGTKGAHRDAFDRELRRPISKAESEGIEGTDSSVQHSSPVADVH